jgi:hypothetical protein
LSSLTVTSIAINNYALASSDGGKEIAVMEVEPMMEVKNKATSQHLLQRMEMKEKSNKRMNNKTTVK